MVQNPRRDSATALRCVQNGGRWGPLRCELLAAWGRCGGRARQGEARSAKQTKSIAFRGPSGLPWMARLGLVEARSVAPWMASTVCQNAGCPVCEADEKHRFSRAERLAMDGKTGVGRSQKRRAMDGKHSVPERWLPGRRSFLRAERLAKAGVGRSHYASQRMIFSGKSVADRLADIPFRRVSR